jgi:hypothetical protein
MIMARRGKQKFNMDYEPWYKLVCPISTNLFRMKNKVGKQKNLLWLWPASESKTFSKGSQHLTPKAPSPHKTPV